MLILTRRVGETIRIGNDISVTVLGVSGKQSRISVTAPAAIEVHREEIFQRIQAGVPQAPAPGATQMGAQFIEDHLGKPPATTHSMHIDDRVRMAANATRYEWLRDRDRVTDFDTDLCVARDDTVYFGHDLDKNVDDAMRLARLEELHPCAD